VLLEFYLRRLVNKFTYIRARIEGYMSRSGPFLPRLARKVRRDIDIDLLRFACAVTPWVLGTRYIALKEAEIDIVEGVGRADEGPQAPLLPEGNSSSPSLIRWSQT
jgi:hypothetical protein